MLAETRDTNAFLIEAAKSAGSNPPDNARGERPQPVEPGPGRVLAPVGGEIQLTAQKAGTKRGMAAARVKVGGGVGGLAVDEPRLPYLRTTRWSALTRSASCAGGRAE